MIAVAVTLNLLVALFCFYVAWRLWRLGKTLGAVADSLVLWERSTHATLNPVVIPPAILRGQRGTAGLRLSYRQLQRQLQQLQRVMAVVGLLPVAGRWLGARGRLSPRLARAKRR
ncbi:MAG TPA: hypothetical protein VLS96_09710 [Nodosilinea sp.]|nr:hypothetical protein [Nodosilinea sp.]